MIDDLLLIFLFFWYFHGYLSFLKSFFFNFVLGLIFLFIPLLTVSTHSTMSRTVFSLIHQSMRTNQFIRCFSSETMTKTQFFLDHYTIDVYAGKGGKGINSFESILLCDLCWVGVATKDGRKIPSGGNGGRGGDIYIRGNPHMDRLSFPKRVYKSSNGENGQGTLLSVGWRNRIGKDMNGSNGRDLFIDVPLGSCIYRIDREEEECIENGGSCDD